MATFVVRNHLPFSNSLKRFTVDNINLSDNVGTLKNEIAKHLSVSPTEIEVVYGGKCLKEGQSIESQNLKPGITLHILKAIEPIPPQQKAKLESTEIQQLMIALRTAMLNPAFRETLQKLSKPETLENIMAATPGLADDSTAVAILQDPDLLLHLMDVNNFSRVVEAHPALAEALNHITAAIHEDTSSTSSGSAAHMLASAYLYPWDGISDDDDDAMDPSEHPNENAGLPADEMAFPAITQAQLASALAAVTSGGSLPNVQPESMDSSSMISPELFSQAVQQAMSAATQAQLQQLRDMGISNDAVSLRALEMTGGDIHAALELIFGDGVNLTSGNSSLQ